MKPVIIIQARTGSTRLSQKIVKPFWGDKTVLDILLERLKTIGNQFIADIIVATTDNPHDDVIEKIGKSHDVKVYRGSEKDVLQRFIDVAETYHADKIIRVCADNVFLDLESLTHLASLLEASDYDYISYKTKDDKPSILTHYGFLAEGVKLSALKDVAEKTNEAIFHEHVTNRIYSAPDLYDVKLYPIEEVIPGIENHPDLRLTLDTQDDFDIQRSIFKDLVYRESAFTPKEIIEYLDKEHPEYYDTMRKTIIANTK